METPELNNLQVESVGSKSRADTQRIASASVESTPRVTEAPAASDSVESLSKAVEILNETLSRDPVALRFTIDETLNRPVVSVVSEKTGEVIHQLPQEEVIRAVKNLDQMRGILFEDSG